MGMKLRGTLFCSALAILVSALPSWSIDCSVPPTNFGGIDLPGTVPGASVMCDEELGAEYTVTDPDDQNREFDLRCLCGVYR